MSEAAGTGLRYTVSETVPQVKTISKTSFTDTLAFLLGVFLPTAAKGVIIRRPAALAIADWLDLDRRAIRAMQHLRRQYGEGPVLLRIPGRSVALVLDPQDVHRILNASPEPFATETPEKRAALAHFEPKGVLISHGAERADRRRYNEQVLQPDRALHAMAARFANVVAVEAHELRRAGIVDWRRFSDVWFRIVRRVIFGDAARDDNELSSTMARLRYAANWAFLRPQRAHLREQLFGRISYYIGRAEPNSLAGLMAHIPATPRTAPAQQVPQWLFAFDAAGIATFRSLALLASHPEYGGVSGEMQHLRATVLESVRLWPTSPLILRESTAPTTWRNGIMPAHTGVVIFAPFFHRDDERLPYANRFYPELWMDGRTEHESTALIPFSAGPAECPGRQLVLLLSTAMLSELTSCKDFRQTGGKRLSATEPLPATLNHYRLRFEPIPS